MEERFEFIPVPKPSRVCIVGTGLVGSTYAYTLLTHGVADEICLIDIDRDRAEGEVMDLNHAMPFARRTEIWAGTMDDLRDADVVAICAGASQKPGETRLDLLKRNASIVGGIAEEAGRICPSAVYLVATNPVDVMTYVVMRKSGCHNSHVMGSGTSLDTARLRFLIGKELGVDPRSIHAFIMGEHGDSEMVAWSRATIAGSSLEDHHELTSEKRQRIFDEVRQAAYKIIQKKGATYYAIGAALSRITESILKDQRTVYSVSAYLEGQYGIFDAYLGVPAVVGRDGVLEILEMPLTPGEAEALQASARVVREAVSKLDLWSGKRSPILTGVSSNSGGGFLEEFARDLGPEQGIEWSRQASFEALKGGKRRRRTMRKPRPI